MQLKISKTAQQWLIKQLDLQPGSGVRFFTPTGGRNGHVNYGPKQSYQREDQPKQPVLQVIIDEINYHIDDQDSWFFSGKTTLIDYDPQNGLTFHFFNGNGEPVDANTAASKGNTRFEGLWN